MVKAVDSKSTGLRPRQFESGRCRNFFLGCSVSCGHSVVAPAWIRRAPPKGKIVGSSPTGGASFKNGVLWCNWLALRTLNPAIRVQVPVGPLLLTLMSPWPSGYGA